MPSHRHQKAATRRNGRYVHTLTVDDDVIDFSPREVFSVLRSPEVGLFPTSPRGWRERGWRLTRCMDSVISNPELSSVSLRPWWSLFSPTPNPTIPIHGRSAAALSQLQKVRNATLRFVYNTKWDEFLTSRSLHVLAAVPAINVQLYQMATAVWESLGAEGGEQIAELMRLHLEAPERNHGWFPRSLRALSEDPDPAPRSL